MKKVWFVYIFLMSTCLQEVYAQTAKPLKKILELKITATRGANGAGVAWHPTQQKYYAAMGGNAGFQMGVYDIKGKLLTDTTHTTHLDVRGLWYNPGTKTLQGNGFSDVGWAEYKLDSKGVPVSTKLLHSGMNQPDDQSTGAFDPKGKVVYFFNEEGHLDVHDYRDGIFSRSIELYLGLTKDEADVLAENYDVIDDYNYTTVIFTGISGAEFGLLNYANNQIELYNAKDGYLTRKLNLPGDAPVEERMNFAYANGIYWLFDRKSRVWKGYK